MSLCIGVKSDLPYKGKNKAGSAAEQGKQKFNTAF
jgi:hypothetical protein